MVVMMINSKMSQSKPIESASEIETVETADTDLDEGLEKGDTPPDFELTTLTGETIKLSDLKGKKVILNFWASWCGPCKAEMPHMENYYKKYKEDANVEIVAVNMTTQERRGLEGIEAFVEEYELTFPIPLDQDGEAINKYRVMTIPTTYMIETNGKIAHKIVGPMDEKTMVQMVNNLE